MLAAETPDPDPLVQLNARVRASTKARMEARRAEVMDPKTGRPVTQGQWLEKAIDYALSAPKRPTSNSRMRTAPPHR